MFDRTALNKVDDLYANLKVNKVTTSNKSGGFAPRKPKPVIRYGSTCQNCGLKMSLSGDCFCG